MPLFPCFSSHWFWPELGCWPGSSPGWGSCVQGCGSGGGDYPAGRWWTVGWIHLEWKRDRAGGRLASGTGPRSPGTTPTPRSPAFYSSQLILCMYSNFKFTPTVSTSRTTITTEAISLTASMLKLKILTVYLKIPNYYYHNRCKSVWKFCLKTT